MEGEDEDSDEPRAFSNKKPWQKIVILAAGSFMNVVCAVVIMALVVGIIGFNTTTVDQVTDGSPAYEAGVNSGDRIISIDGDEIDEWADISQAISTSEGDSISMVVERNGEENTLDLTPVLIESFQSSCGRRQGNMEYDYNYV